MVLSLGSMISIALRLLTHRSEIEKVIPRVQKSAADLQALWPRVQADIATAMQLASDIQQLAAKIAPDLVGQPTGYGPPGEPHYDVRWLQESLKYLGYDPGPIDGTMGPLTMAATKKFQEASGLVADGWAGAATTAAIDALLRKA